ncbi:TetR/AcrR family transcriptional regulator [Nocardioides plantarum]|uniref:TetR/AcrR family transcriptional regulator n=1 Tax=Nocardioides plantarum TaxID=29299 RepID=A0ABV5KC66_9ACTN|nr:TetR/AcrR family transcriptional regulator [Nocardioides plantarum]
MTRPPTVGTRFDQRRAKTRASLITAAQALLAEGRSSATIQEVTERADVGTGSFYNHFSSRDDLFVAAIADAAERYAQLLDTLGTDRDDPAALFSRSFRLTGRLHRRERQLSRILLAHGHQLSQADSGFAPRARRDIEAAHHAGRFHAPDIDRAMVVVTGSMIELGHLLHDRPDRDDAATVDAVTSDVLVALGMSRTEAEALCDETLPILPALTG